MSVSVFPVSTAGHVSILWEDSCVNVRPVSVVTPVALVSQTFRLNCQKNVHVKENAICTGMGKQCKPKSDCS